MNYWEQQKKENHVKFSPRRCGGTPHQPQESFRKPLQTPDGRMARLLSGARQDGSCFRAFLLVPFKPQQTRVPTQKQTHMNFTVGSFDSVHFLCEKERRFLQARTKG